MGTVGRVDVTEVIAQRVGAAAEGVWSAPGRVNLIGEHTDYNDGLCLPLALPLRTRVAASRRADDVVVMSSEGFGRVLRVDLGEAGPGRPKGWAAYVVGVLWALRQAGHEVGGMELAFVSDVPSGAGLSSSAALECAVGAAASDLADLIQELTGQMHQAATDLHFELAARLRDEIGDLKKELRQMTEATR